VYVQTHSLSKRYSKVTALDDCTLNVNQGEVFGLLGPNGSGKTTLLRLLLGLIRPTAGTATIDGLDCCKQSLDVRRRVAYLPGEVRLFRGMRASQVLDFFAQIRTQQNVAHFHQCADRLNLNLARRVTHMSTGMRQKLGLCATLATNTPLIVLDEPTSHLDPSVRHEVITVIREAQKAGRTIIFSSHVLSEVEEVCDRVVILRQGQLVLTQVMSALKRQHRISARLLGPLTPVPESLNGRLNIRQESDGRVTIETSEELAPLFGWLSTLPLAEVQIQPTGLRAVYEQCHRK